MDYQALPRANSIAQMISQVKSKASKEYPQQDCLYSVGTIVLQLIILGVSLAERAYDFSNRLKYYKQTRKETENLN